MTQLSYKGAALSTSQDVAYRPYPTTLKSADLTSTSVNALIDAKLNSYPSAATIQGMDALLCDTAYIDGQDALRMTKDKRGAPNGVAPLDNTAKIPPAYIPITSTQSWNGTPVIPITYNLDPTLVLGTDNTTLYTCPIPDPGYPYRLLVWGNVDASSTNDYTVPTAKVRVGSITGTIIAQGGGAADGVVSLKMGDDFERSNNNTLGEDWNVVFAGDGETSMAIRSNEADLLQAFAPHNKMVSATCQRVEPNTRYTGTNFQKITLKVGSRAGSVSIDTPKTGYPYFRMYMRANDAFTQYVAFEVGNNTAQFVYNTGSGERYFSTNTPIDHTTEWTANTTWYAYAGGNPSNVSERLFTLYKEGLLVMSVTDSGQYTMLGPANRGWGFGLQNSLYLLGQEMSPTVEEVWASDLAWPYEPIVVMPSSQVTTTLTGSQTLYIQASLSNLSPPMGVDPNGTGAYSSRRPSLFAMVVPVDSSPGGS